MVKMIRLWVSFALCSLCSVWWTGHAAVEKEMEEMGELDALLRELEAFEDLRDLLSLETPRWMVIPSLRAGAGYRDNVLLSEISESGGFFLSAGGDIIVTNLPGGGTDFTLLLSGENIHFPGKREFPDEHFILAHGRWEVPLSDSTSLLMGGQGFHHRKRIDISTVVTLDGDQGAVDMIGGGASALAGLRQGLGERLAVTGEFSTGKQWFRQPLDDYREIGPKCLLSWRPNPTREWTLSLEHVRRDYTGLQARTADGTPMAGRDLRFDLTRGDLEQSLQWRLGEGRLSIVSKAGVEFNRDNGGRYFDYTRWRADQRLDYARGKWRWRVKGDLSYFEYDRQKAGPGQTSPRRRLPWGYELETGRQLAENVSAYLRYTREAASSNRRDGNYRVNTIGGMVEWEF